MGWEWDSGFWRKAERVNAGLTRGWKSKKKGIETARTSQEEGGTKQDRGTRVDTTVYSLSALAAAELGGGEVRGMLVLEKRRNILLDYHRLLRVWKGVRSG